MLDLEDTAKLIAEADEHVPAKDNQARNWEVSSKRKELRDRYRATHGIPKHADTDAIPLALRGTTVRAMAAAARKSRSEATTTTEKEPRMGTIDRLVALVAEGSADVRPERSKLPKPRTGPMDARADVVDKAYRQQMKRSLVKLRRSDDKAATQAEDRAVANSDLRGVIEDLRSLVSLARSSMSPPGPAVGTTVTAPPGTAQAISPPAGLSSPGNDKIEPPVGPPMSKAGADPVFQHLYTLLMGGLRDNLDLDKLGAEELRAMRSFVKVVQLSATMTPEMAREHVAAAFVPVVKQGLMHIGIGPAIRDAVHEFLGEDPHR